MIKEKSCGAIIYEVRDEIMFLILKILINPFFNLIINDFCKFQ